MDARHFSLVAQNGSRSEATKNLKKQNKKQLNDASAALTFQMSAFRLLHDKELTFRTLGARFSALKLLGWNNRCLSVRWPISVLRESWRSVAFYRALRVKPRMSLAHLPKCAKDNKSQIKTKSRLGALWENKQTTQGLYVIGIKWNQNGGRYRASRPFWNMYRNAWRKLSF